MKLSLWMVANRLEPYDIETRISPTTERTIGGPLPVSTLRSLCVRKKGNDVLCSSAQGTILIHNMTEDEGFLLIQSIFDWYDDWIERIESTIQEKDYRRFVHLCAQAFGNPVLFLDSNKLLAGMDCRGVDVDSLPEWRYISEKGQISVPYYAMMAKALGDPVRRYGSDVIRFMTGPRGSNGRVGSCEGLHVRLRYLSNEYGTITVLDKKRRLTLGDVALLELLAEKGALLFAAADGKGVRHSDTKIMNELLEFKEVPEERLAFVRSILEESTAGRGDLCLFLFRYDVEEGRSELQNLLQSILMRRYPTVFCWNYRSDFLVISKAPDPKVLAQQMLSFVDSQGYAKNLRVSVSLPFGDLIEIPYFYEQALFAVNRLKEPGICSFYDCATAYLLETHERKRRVYACEPYCRKEWQSSPEGKKTLETVAVYLAYERASATAADELFVHKNTLSYRIRNVKEATGWDFEDPVLRDYLRLSVYFLSQLEGPSELSP